MRKLSDIIVVTVILFIMVSAQILAKIGAMTPRNGLLDLNAFLAVSYILYILRGILWSFVLSRCELSRVYPWLSLSFPLVLLAGLWFLGETLTPGMAIGSAFILSGSALLVSEKT